MKTVLALAITHVLVGPAFADIDATEQSAMVAEHNKLRAAENAGLPNLKWSSSLASTAQSWANTLKGKGCALEHSKGSGFGENIYWGGPMMYGDGTTKATDTKSKDVVGSWYSEKANYTLGTNTCAAGKTCGHYTQVVWKATTDVGCGQATCDDNSQVWVCNYSPAGNMAGEKPY